MTNTTEKKNSEPLLHVAVFDEVADADQAIADLLLQGVSKDAISVVCPADLQKRYADLDPEQPAGALAAPAAAAGAVVGGTLGWFVTVAGALTGGLAVLAAGPLLLGVGGVSGGLIGAMMSRGVESRLARHYDHAVGAGKILVAAHADHPAAKLLTERASRPDVEARPVTMEAAAT